MAETRAKLAHLLMSGGRALEPLDCHELVIYGAGNCGRGVAAAARDRGVSVRAFLDARAGEINEVDGLPCHCPDSAAALRAAADGVPVVVAIFNCATNVVPIFEMLRAVGFRRIVSFYEIHEEFEMEPQFWLGRRSECRNMASEILAGFDLFEDEISRQIYYDLIALRLTFDTALLAQPDQSHHYALEDLPMGGKPLRMVDGGAFTGDTVEELLRRGIDIEAVAAFEPDPANFKELKQRLTSGDRQVREVILFPCGVSEQTGIRGFTAGQGAASALGNNGDTHVQVVALDDVLPTFGPNFIKLDIEGAEPSALRGAAEMIAACGPTLAVCVYHQPEHLWSIPMLIRKLRSDYRFKLRYHQFNGFDCVVYAFSE